MEDMKYKFVVKVDKTNAGKGMGFIIVIKGGNIDPSSGVQLQTVNGVMRMYQIKYEKNRFELNSLLFSSITEFVLYGPKIFEENDPVRITEGSEVCTGPF